MEPTTLALVAAAFFAAGCVKGVSGMGLPTVVMGLLGALLSPLTAASLATVPTFLTNVWQLFSGASLGPLAKRFGLMLVLTFTATLAGTSLIVRLDADQITGALGVVLALYATYGLLARPFSLSPLWERRLAPVSGLFTGAITGATGAAVVPLVPFLQSLDLSKDDLVQSLGLSFTVSSLALAIGLAWHGALQLDVGLISIAATLPAVAGMIAGQSLRRRISQALFRRLFFIAIALLGLEMATRAVRG